MDVSRENTMASTIQSRQIGRVTGSSKGPTVVVVCGIHGNEPAGIEATRRILSRLDRGDIRIAGELMILAGNLAALQMSVRHQVKDLNRVWSEKQVAALRDRHPSEDDAEDREQRELLAAIEAAQGRARGPVYLADFHTTSASGIPFVIFGDTLEQRRFVQAFPIPIVIGLEEQIDGALSSYWTRRGCVTFSVEGGQHMDKGSVDNLEAVLWLTMARAGLLSDTTLPELTAAAELLEQKRAGLPRVLEVLSRRAISPEDAFRMEPGFRNLDHAAAGRLLARDRNGEIRAEDDGVVILPLYQGLGSDGFFWGRAVSRVRMKAAEVLRRVRADWLLGFLPGVRRDPNSPRRLILQERTRSEVELDALYLFGYRRFRQDEGNVVLERQTHN